MRWNIKNGRDLVTLFLEAGLDLGTSNADTSLRVLKIATN